MAVSSQHASPANGAGFELQSFAYIASLLSFASTSVDQRRDKLA